jgi:hypothetical protein
LPDDGQPALVGLGEVALDPGGGAVGLDDGGIRPRDLDGRAQAGESSGLVGPDG